MAQRPVVAAVVTSVIWRSILPARWCTLSLDEQALIFCPGLIRAVDDVDGSNHVYTELFIGLRQRTSPE
jgi:hypothetical protein